MDYELSMALFTLWFASTFSLFIAAAMFLHNSGEAFHPHSIVMDHRHTFFSVVGAKTVCKTDFAVKSISAYFAPRGSTSDKIFTVLIVLCAVAGFLGSVRWYSIGDGSYTETVLCQVGFASMILVVIFEVPVTPQSFFHDKLLLTYWMAVKLQLQPYFDFKISPTSPKFLNFIRTSDDIRHLYEEDEKHEMKPVSTFAAFTLGFNLHALGASLYVCSLTLAVILNDSQEHRVAYITGFFFVLFAALGYTSGTYLPAAPITRGMILIWNPFLREPDFLIKLQDAAIKYYLHHNDAASDSLRISSKQIGDDISKGRKKRRKGDKKRSHIERTDYNDSNKISKGVRILDIQERSGRARDVLNTHYNINWAHDKPKQYTRMLSHLMVTVELAAMITPIIALGVQWIISLCDSSDTPHNVFFSAFFAWCECLWSGDYECAELEKSCILFNTG